MNNEEQQERLSKRANAIREIMSENERLKRELDPEAFRAAVEDRVARVGLSETPIFQDPMLVKYKAELQAFMDDLKAVSGMSILLGENVRANLPESKFQFREWFKLGIIVTAGAKWTCVNCNQMITPRYMEGIDIWVLPYTCSRCADAYNDIVEMRRADERAAKQAAAQAKKEAEGKPKPRRAKTA